MEQRTSDDVWAHIDRIAREHPGGVVATDGDGTLWSGDVGEDLFRAFLDHGRTEAEALDALRRSASAHSLSDAGSGCDVARRIYAGYANGRFPEEALCELMTWCFAGWDRAEVREFARGVVDRGGLMERLHGEVHSVIDRARGAGLEVFLVSASPLAVVLEAGARVGFDERHVVAARPRYKGDVMLADVHRPIPYGPGKVLGLRERIGPDRTVLAAFGDNSFDVPLLLGSQIPVAVRPKPRLREHAADVPDLVELAPSAAFPHDAKAR